MTRDSWNRPVLSAGAEEVYQTVRDLPIVSPHSHCDPNWFSTDAAFSDPADLLIVPDHYVFRMLYSQGIPLEKLGIGVPPSQRNPREIFRLLAANWHLFLGTPSRQWLDYTFHHIFQIDGTLGPDTADAIFDQIAALIAKPEFRPRRLLETFNIEVLATTDGALDTLDAHHEIAASDWHGRIIPTFRPDSVLNPNHANFARDFAGLDEVSQTDTGDYRGYLEALRKRRNFFIEHGATATDHDVPDLATGWLGHSEVGRLYQDIRRGTANSDEGTRFYNHMLIEMAQMSLDDRLTMQLHVGSQRSTNGPVADRFGPDMGADIPKAVSWVTGLDALLNRVGNNAELSLIAFTLDETAYARELAPMAGHWPALKIGPPWWFHDSWNGILRYLDRVVETAGYWNLSGFNDDTRAFLSIPARHDLWRRAISHHLNGQVKRGIFGKEDAGQIARALSYDLAKSAYRLN